MKRKAIAGMMLTLVLTVTLFIAVPVKPQPWAGTIKIGVIGPMSWDEGKALKDGAKLCAKQINDAGGIVTTETWGGGVVGAWNVRIIPADTLRGQPEPNIATGTAAAMELVADGVDYIIGGFRTEDVYGIREVVADWALSGTNKPIYIIAGASTNELIDHPDIVSYPATVRSDYNRYRFVFRNRHNSTMLLYSIAAFSKYIMAAKLMPIITAYASPLKVAVISEDLTWTQAISPYLAMNYFWNTILGMAAYGDVDVVNFNLVGATATDVSSELLAAEAAGAKIIIHALSGPVGKTFTTQWNALGIDALPMGINVDATDPAYWSRRFTAPEYETTLAAAGTRTPITPLLTAFWKAYVATYEDPPIEAAYRAYDSVMAIKDMVQAVGKWPMGAKEMVPYTEQTLRLRADLPGGTAMLGTFRYTGPHPMSDVTYDTYMANATHSYLDLNPTKMGTLHDVYMTSAELAPVWYSPYYTRPLFVQWQKHPVPRARARRLEVVYPLSEPYSKKFKIPPWIYEAADVDISGNLGFPDGYVNAIDIGIACYCWLSTPGDPAWINYGGFAYPGLVADQDGNGIINVGDTDEFGRWYGYDATETYGQWPLG